MSGSRKSNQTLGFPEGFKVHTSFPFAGMNQSASRIAMKNEQFYWLENFTRTGDGALRTLWDVGPALYTVTGAASIVSFFWFSIGKSNYAIAFLDDGTAMQVSESGSVTNVSLTPDTFYQTTSGYLPACSQYGTSYLLISNRNTTDDYWAWDGDLLYGAGTIAPGATAGLTSAGANYLSVPSYTVFGGSGSGVQLQPVVTNGAVTALTILNPGSGYLPGDVAQVAFSGGGTDSSAILTAVLNTTTVEFLILLSGGSGYTAGTYSLGFSGGGGGSGAAGAFTVSGNIVTSVTLTSVGSGYTTAPTVSFPGAGGSGAVAETTLYPTSVASITITQAGSGFPSAPTLTLSGGGGTGAGGTVTISGGAINSTTVTTAGSNYTEAPTVVVQSGINNAASAILTLMPYGVSGSTLETYQQRVFIAYPNEMGNENNGGTFLVSAPESLSDFATSTGGDIFSNTDRFLRSQYTFLRQTANFLYAVADSSTSVISNVATSATTPATTTFSYQNADPQIGSSWRDSAQDFSNTILFGNTFGIYGIYGGSVRKISSDVDNIFNAAVLPPTSGALTPSSATANLYSRKHYLMLLTITDPFTNAARNVMLLWDQQSWFVASQSADLIYIGTQEVNSGITAWGTDGTSLYPLFQTASSTLVKKISTKQWGGDTSFMVKMAHSLYLQAMDVSTAQSGITFSSASIDGTGLALLTANSVTQQIISAPSISLSFNRTLEFLAPSPLGAMYALAAPQVPGVALGVTLVSSSPDFVLQNLTLGYIDYSGVA